MNDNPGRSLLILACFVIALFVAVREVTADTLTVRQCPGEHGEMVFTDGGRTNGSCNDRKIREPISLPPVASPAPQVADNSWYEDEPVTRKRVIDRRPRGTSLSSRDNPWNQFNDAVDKRNDRRAWNYTRGHYQKGCYTGELACW